MTDLRRAAFAQSIVRGLDDTPRWLSCRYLYDAAGSALFCRITEQPEYYLTRAEDALLADHAAAIRALVGRSTLAELGCGSAAKTRHLLSAWLAADPAARYVPIDICADVLAQTAATLAVEVPSLTVEPWAMSYERALEALPALSPTTLAFLGSSIGNLNAEEQDRFFARSARALAPGDHLLLGVDLVKDPALLEAAYDDAAGVTAEFTKNLFARMNRELGTTVDLAAVDHVAWWDERLDRIAIHARFRRPTTISLPDHGRTFHLAAGELILTEISTKFRIADVAALATRHGLDHTATFGGEVAGFALLLFRRGPHPMRPAARLDAARLLAATRTNTLELVAPLDDTALARQWSPLMSPIVWDLGHVANFEDQWIRSAHRPRERRGDEARARDHVYDAVAHARATRGTLGLLDRAGALAYLDDVRARTTAALEDTPADAGSSLLRDGFVHRMLAQHEAQHTETILQTIQLAGIAYEPARRERPPSPRRRVDSTWRAFVPAGPFLMGTDDRTLAYDNERPLHEVAVPAFRIDVTPVTNAAFLRFIDADGYRRRELWDAQGWAWLADARLSHPGGWVRDAAGAWNERAFGRTAALDLDQPVVHVSWYEAAAYARFAGARLPTEAEWEKAAAWDLESFVPRRHPWGDDAPTAAHANLDQRTFAPAPVGAYPAGTSYYGCHQMLGCVWEWTASEFAPYPGFEVFPYPEYSAVHFGRGYKVLRGGSWATQSLVARNTFRNWDLPERRQIFAGFRCVVDA